MKFPTNSLIKGGCVFGLDLAITQGGKMTQQHIISSAMIGAVSTLVFATSEYLIKSRIIPSYDILPFINEAEWEERIIEAGLGYGSIVGLNMIGNQLKVTHIPNIDSSYFAPAFVERDTKMTTVLFIAGDILGEYIIAGM
jgi:hypothetical protein